MRKTRWVLGAMGIVLIGGSAALLRGKHASVERGAAAASASADRTVPVAVSNVTRSDVPIYLDGLGTVTPLASVTVKSQVDGPLDSVGFKEGQFVKKGDVLAQVDPRPFTIKVHQAQATLAKDQAQLQNARATLSRYEALLQNGLVSQQQVDDQRAQVSAQEALLQSDRTGIESARLQLEYAHITSPIDGVTGVRLVDPGNVIRASDTAIVVVTQLDPMGVVFTLPQDDLPRVNAELAKGPITVEAFSRDGARKLSTGQLLVVDNQINSTTGTIRLKATFPNADHQLWPNGFVKARLLLTTRKDAVVVPATVVQKGPQGTFAYVVEGDRAAVRPIVPDTFQGDSVIVAKGLAPGDKVVVDGQNQLKPGGRVAVRPPDKPQLTSGSAPSGSAPAGSAARQNERAP